MSHNIMHRDYELNVNRNKVQKGWDDYVAHADYGEGATGLPNPIRWVENGISNSYEEAMERIEKMDNGWYDQIAVKYKSYKPCSTKKYNELKTRMHQAFDNYHEKMIRIHYAAENVKSEFITCKHCGSKIATKYIKTNICPVCRTDMRPQSVLQSIENAQKKHAELLRQMKEEEKKAKYEVRWLVKIEYHT